MRAAIAAALLPACMLLAAASSPAQVRLYHDDVPQTPYTNVVRSFSLGSRAISGLTPEGHRTVGDLVAASFWDFSGLSAGGVSHTTQVPISGAETCHAGRCGFSMGSNDYLIRIDGSGGDKTVTAIDYDGVNTFYMRALVANEGAENELRTCFDPNGHTQVPLFRFPNDGGGGAWYMQAGDTWRSGRFDCETSAYLSLNGCDGGIPTDLADQSGHSGRYESLVVNDGTLVLPTGHVLDALVIRSMADFSAHDPLLPCWDWNVLQEVKAWVYSWVVPGVGIVFTANSGQNEGSATGWTTSSGTTVAHGLLPPLAITLAGEGYDRVLLDLDPGAHSGYIDRFKVYWDVDSGAPYAFDSDTHPAQVSWDGLRAEVGGLECDRTYHLTMTSLYGYTDPDSGITTEYESLLYPEQLLGSPDHRYPVEVVATTRCDCAPTEEVRNLRVARSGDEVALSWDAVDDPCLDRYETFEALDPLDWAGFAGAGSSGAGLTHTFANAGGFFLVAAAGPGGELGPVGHYTR